MPRLNRARITYRAKDSKRQTRNVEYRGDGGPDKNADTIKAILAGEHRCHPSEVKLFLGGEPAQPKGTTEKPVAPKDLDKLAKADLVELAIKAGVEVDASQSTGKVREQLKAGLEAKAGTAAAETVTEAAADETGL